MDEFKLMNAPRLNVCIAINKPVDRIGELVGKFDIVYAAFNKSHIEQAREFAKSDYMEKVFGSFILNGCSHAKLAKDMQIIYPHANIWVM